MIQIIMSPQASGFLSPPVIAALITAMTALMTGGFVVYYARRQARIASDKLALDLFDRRYAAYQALEQAMNRRHHELLYNPEAFGPDIFRWRDFYLAMRDIEWLFGKDVNRLTDDCSRILDELEEHHNRILGAGVAIEKWFNDHDFQQSNFAFNSARSALDRHFAAYMKFGHVSVAKPDPKREWE